MKMEDMKLKMLIFGLPLLSIVTAAPSLDNYNNQWEDFKVFIQKMFKKEYSREEEGARRLIFERNVEKVLNHNNNADLKKHSYRMGINKFTDRTAEEFSRLNRFEHLAERTGKGSPFVAQSNANYPKEVDWRKEGLVTEVKDQGNCNSSWAFSATGSLEGQYKRKTGKLVSLSEQNLIDCSNSTGNAGCAGGSVPSAFVFIFQNGGIDTEESYPYEAKDGTCRFDIASVGATVNGFTLLPEKDEIVLQQVVAVVGPISIIVAASYSELRHYSSGIFDPENCSSDGSYHHVLVVGYGTENGKDYWLIKNSWGKNWGEDGYFRMVRNSGNECGVVSMPCFPMV